jgi:hypothetical protein
LPEFDDELEDDEFDEEEFDEDEFDEEEPEPDEGPEFEDVEVPDDPDPLPEPEEDDDPELWSELWCEEPELPALRVSPASESPRCPPPPSCFGGLWATGGGSLGGFLYGGSGYFSRG